MSLPEIFNKGCNLTHDFYTTFGRFILSWLLNNEIENEGFKGERTEVKKISVHTLLISPTNTYLQQTKYFIFKIKYQYNAKNGELPSKSNCKCVKRRQVKEILNGKVGRIMHANYICAYSKSFLKLD